MPARSSNFRMSGYIIAHFACEIEILPRQRSEFLWRADQIARSNILTNLEQRHWPAVQVSIMAEVLKTFNKALD